MDDSRQPPRVLVVEDDEHVAAVQLEHLRQAGLRTEHLTRGDAVVAHVRTHAPDLVLLDLMLPGADGTEVCRALRAFSNVPILMVSARGGEMDRLLGFDLGADDYLCKPFSPRELVARVQALLRRLGRLPLPLPAPVPAQVPPPRLLELDATAQRALWQGEALDLTPQEFRLLSVLAGQPGRVFSRAQLIALAYDGSTEVFDRAVDSHVKNLRRKLAAAAPTHGFIHSVYGVGYRFEIKPLEQAAEPAPGAEQPVRVPADLRERLPGFLASRRALIEEVRQALARGEPDAVRRLAHRLAGSFALYGYTWAAQGCLRIENAAALEPAQVASWLEALGRHLDGAPVRFVAAA